jgi:hypothetical protein
MQKKSRNSHGGQGSLKSTFHDICNFLVYPALNMRSIVCYVLIISVLFMSTEGLWDMAKETHPHNDLYAHQVDANHPAATDSNPLSDDCLDHCQNLCHGHLSSIVSNSSEALLLTTESFLTVGNAHIPVLLQAPPTPPPNA